MYNLVSKIYFLFLTVISTAPMHLILPNQTDSQWHFPFLEFIPADKLTHLLLYLPLGLLLTKQKSVNKKMISIAFTFGIATEVVQYFIPYRSFDLLDLVANEIGIILPYLLVRLKKQIESAQ